MPRSEEIKKVFSAETAKSGMVHLNTKQADAFIDYVKDETSIIKNARLKKMNSPIETIAKIGIGDTIFHPAKRGVKLDENKRVEASADSIKLITKEIIAEVRILDDELEDNIEGKSFKEHLMRMVAKKGANQIEKAMLYAREVEEGDSINNLFNGLFIRVEDKGNIVDASDVNIFSDRFIDKNKLSKAYKSIPTKYRSDLNKIYMPNDLTIDYEGLYEKTMNEVTKKGAFGLNFNNSPLMDIQRPTPTTKKFTLAVNGNKGERSITLTDVTGLSEGEAITLALGKNKEFTTEVISVNTSTKVVTLSDTLPYNFDSSNTSENDVKLVTTDGAEVIITNDKNMIWGVQRNISIESERSARERATYFVITMRCDFQVENPEAIAVIKNLKVK